MRSRSTRFRLVTPVLGFALLLGCKSSDNGDTLPDGAALADSGSGVRHDAETINATIDAATDTAGATTPDLRADVSIQGSDGVADSAPRDGGTPPDDAIEPTIDLANAIDSTAPGAPSVDAIGTEPDPAKPDAAMSDAAFTPDAATAIVVNSGPTGDYSLANDTWKVFYFDAEASQLYLVAGLSDTERGFVSTDPRVSPSNYQLATDDAGVLSFVAPATQRYYVAVAATGGGASGWIQVADGGSAIALGKTTLTLTAPHGEDSYVYRFPVTAGHDYVLAVDGPAQPTVGITVSPTARRSIGGQFTDSAWSVSGALPFDNQTIAADSVAKSYSGFYYIYVRVTAPITLTITVTAT
jgi:hypothetical protein